MLRNIQESLKKRRIQNEINQRSKQRRKDIESGNIEFVKVFKIGPRIIVGYEKIHRHGMHDPNYGLVHFLGEPVWYELEAKTAEKLYEFACVAYQFYITREKTLSREEEIAINSKNMEASVSNAYKYLFKSYGVRFDLVNSTIELMKIMTKEKMFHAQFMEQINQNLTLMLF